MARHVLSFARMLMRCRFGGFVLPSNEESLYTVKLFNKVKNLNNEI